MGDFLKKNIVTVLIVLATLVLAGIAVFTAIRLYQLRQKPVAPTVPESKPKAAAPQCLLTFTLGETPTPTPTGTATPSATPTGSPTATPTATPTGSPTPTPTSPPGCDTTCTTTSDCPGTLVCSSGRCRNNSCPTETDCLCATSTPTPTGTPRGTATPTPTGQPELPEAGVSLPTFLGAGFGLLLLFGALVLAL